MMRFPPATLPPPGRQGVPIRRDKTPRPWPRGHPRPPPWGLRARAPPPCRCPPKCAALRAVKHSDAPLSQRLIALEVRRAYLPTFTQPTPSQYCMTLRSEL